MRYYAIMVLLVFTNYCLSQRAVNADELKRLDPANEIDVIILRESKSLDTLLGPTPIWSSDRVDTQYDERFGVIINKSRIFELLEQHQSVKADFIIRLILAHEKMHARQLIGLRNVGKTYAGLSHQEKQAMESQADICAGYAAFGRQLNSLSEILFKAVLSLYRENYPVSLHSNFKIVEPTDDELQQVNDLSARNEAAINLFFKLGENEGQFGQHPDSYSRQQSFQIGLNGFFVHVLQEYLRKHGNDLSPSEWEFLQADLSHLVSSLGILPQDYNGHVFFDRWSERMAFKTTHIIQNAAKNVIFNILEQNWDTRQENPFLSFTIEVKNNNPDPVDVDFSVLTKQVARDDPNNPLKSRTGSSWQRYVTIAPHASVQFKDSVRWIVSSEKLMPRVFFPGSYGSLYAVYLTEHSKRFSYLEIDDSQVVSSPALTSVQLFSNLPTVMEQFNSKGINELKAGAGLRVPYKSETSYSAYLMNSHFYMILPDSDTDNPYLKKHLENTAEKPAARTLLKKFAAELLNDDSYSLTTESDEDYLEISRQGNVECYLYLEQKNNAYDIFLEIPRKAK